MKVDASKNPVSAAPKVRFDLLEEDYLLTGGLDDRVVTLLGTDTPPPEEVFSVRRRIRVRKRGEPGELVAPYRGAAPRAVDRLDLPLLADRRVVVHKIRGVMRWPVSRNLLTGAGAVPNPAFAAGLATHPRGLPARGTSVFLLPVPEGASADHRPRSTGELATWDRVVSMGWTATFPLDEGRETPFSVTLTLTHRTLRATVKRKVAFRVRERA